MSYIKTLTVNGNRYTVRDPEAARMDDSVVGTDCWSSKKTVDKLCPGFSESGDAVTCEPVAGYPLGVISQISPTQTGSGDPSPDNVRPIAGHTAVSLYRAGKNLLNSTAVTATTKGVTFTVAEDGSIIANGTATGDVYYDVGRAQIKTGNTYTLMGCPAGGDASTTYCIYVSHEGKNYYDAGSGKTFHAVADKNNTFRILVKTGVTLSGVVFRPMVYLSADAGDTYTAQLEQKVYGGSYDWSSGTLTIDKAVYTVTGQEQILRDDSVTDHMFLLEHGQDTALFAPCSCSHFLGTENEAASGLAEEAVSAFVPYFAFNSQTLALWEDPADYFAQQYAAGTPVQIVYSLAQPITVQCTPQEILAIPGVNTLFSREGTVTVSGRKDPVAVIEDLTNAILALGGNI